MAASFWDDHEAKAGLDVADTPERLVGRREGGFERRRAFARYRDQQSAGGLGIEEEVQEDGIDAGRDFEDAGRSTAVVIPVPGRAARQKAFRGIMSGAVEQRDARRPQDESDAALLGDLS